MLTSYLRTYQCNLVLLFLIFSNEVWALSNPWEQVTSPAAGNIKIIGGYSAGCIQGAVSLLPDEKGFAIMRQYRRRYYTHPRMRQFVIWLSQAIQEHKLGKLLVGDLSQARGGPTTKGHASHQNGLDVDLWFWLDSPAVKRSLTKKEKNSLDAPSMLNAANNGVNTNKFTEANVQMLKLVAKHPDVERIFVNPYIKKFICKYTGGASWLRKLRPWWGHDDHLHVRLSCPPNQPECVIQESIEKTDECGNELDWWLGSKAEEESRKIGEKNRFLTPEQRLKAKLVKVPASCNRVLNAN